MLLLAGLESSPQTDPGLVPETHAVQTGKFLPGYSFQELQRLAVNKGIDAAKKLIGKETIDFIFDCELLASGVIGVEPAWGKLIEACGFTKAVLAVATIDNPIAGYGNAGLSGLAVAKSGTFTGTAPKIYQVKVTTAGASGVAEVSVTCLGDDTQNSVENTVTTETPITLGDEGASMTFTFASGSLTKGDKWFVHCYPPGIRYKPTAANGTFKSAFFYHYLGGLLFKGGGARGNFTLSAPSGEAAKLAFNFKSVFAGVTDAEVPDHTFPDTVPAIVEWAGLYVDGSNALLVQEMSVESNNSIVERRNVNAPQGLEEYRISERDNQFAIDPEATTEAEFAAWDKMRKRVEIPISFKIGNTPGNIVHVQVRRGVIDNLGPTEQDNWLRYGITGQCRPSPAGNDNIELFLC
jgi:hypothetical protein